MIAATARPLNLPGNVTIRMFSLKRRRRSARKALLFRGDSLPAFFPNRENWLRFNSKILVSDGPPVYLLRLQATTAGGEPYLQCQVRVLYTFPPWQMQHNRRRPTLSSSVMFSTRVPLGLSWKT